MEERQGEPITLFRLHVYSRERENHKKKKKERKKDRRVRSMMKRDEERESYIQYIGKRWKWWKNKKNWSLEAAQRQK